MCMEATDLYTARVRVVEAMEQGLSWQEAAKRAGLEISQSTAYREDANQQRKDAPRQGYPAVVVSAWCGLAKRVEKEGM